MRVDLPQIESASQSEGNQHFGSSHELYDVGYPGDLSVSILRSLKATSAAKFTAPVVTGKSVWWRNATDCACGEVDVRISG